MNTVDANQNNLNVTDNIGHDNMTLLEIEEIDDNNVYYVFDRKE